MNLVRTRVARSLLATALAVTTLVVPAAAAQGARSDVAQARIATAQYLRVDNATDAGYALLTDAAGIACIDNPGVGGMGIHYANGALVGDPTVAVTSPEVLVYEPSPSGRLRLVALEYVVLRDAWEAAGNTEPPTLYGREFMLVEAGNRYGLPAFYELHAWLWKHNPRGMFDDWNSRVGCGCPH